MTTPHPQPDSPPLDVERLKQAAEVIVQSGYEWDTARNMIYGFGADEAWANYVAAASPANVLRLIARIAELEAERETARQVAATLYQAYAAAQRAAAAFYRYIMATAAMKAHMDSCKRCLQDYICEELEKLEEQSDAAFAAAMEAARDFKP